MSALITIGIILGLLVFLCLVFKVFASPLKTIFKFVINTALGFVALILINYFGSMIGISIGVNLVNALIVGGLGVPGVGLLLLLKWLMLT